MAKVSVCIPTFNSEKFVADALESVLAQTFSDFEIIVVDNNSSDGTCAIVDGYAKEDSRVSLYRNETNLGMVNNWNRCLEYARGEYIKLLCSDDTISPDCLARAVEVLDEDETLGFVTCARQVVDAELRPLHILRFAKTSGKWERKEVYRRIFSCLNPIGEPSAVVFRRKYIERGFNNRYNQLSDIEMWMHILKDSNMYFFADVMCFFRQHDLQCTKKNLVNLDAIEEELKILSDYKDSLNADFTRLALLKVGFVRSLFVYRRIKQGYPQAEIKAIIDRHFGYWKFRLLYPFRGLIRLVKA